MPQEEKTGQGTQCVWAGEERFGSSTGAGDDAQSVDVGIPTQIPVVHSVSFGYQDVEKWLTVARGEKGGHIYGRNSNPTVDAFEQKVCRLEGAEAATSASTGMGIISSTLFALLLPGHRVVSVKDTYGGTTALFQEFYRLSSSDKTQVQ